MKDFVGNELEVGDVVVIKNPGGSGICLGKILKIGEKRVTIHHTTIPASKYRRKRPSSFNKTVLTPDKSVYKILESDLTAIVLRDRLPVLEEPFGVDENDD